MTCPELAVGTRLRTMLGKELRVITELNRSSLGVIYSIYYDERPAVLRWYRPESPHDKARFADYVREKVMRGSPSRQFIWPIDMVKGDGDALGCVIDQMPDGFVGLWRLLQRPSMFPFFRRVVDACLGIVTMFPSLHERGYCFQEVSVDKLFANPETGNVLANVEDEIAPAGMRNYLFGDQRFMAPEIVAERAFPSMQSDLHSMAVLVFMLLCGSQHPLEGRLLREGAIDSHGQRRLYGTDPVFVFDPDDPTNRPDSAVSSASRIWPYLPQHMRNFFCRAFSHEALRNPSRRPQERKWLRELARLRSEVVTCHCGNEVFLDGAEPTRCERCGALCGAPLLLEVGALRFAVSCDTRLYRCQLGRVCPSDKLLEPQLLAIAPKGNRWDTGNVALRNVSSVPWVARFGDEEHDIAPGKAVRAVDGLELEVLDEKVHIVANPVTAKADEPPALNLIYVLDTSGSMCGDAIDVLNRALCRVMDALRVEATLLDGRGIRVSVLEFNSESRWVISASPVSVGELQVELLEAGGCTVMSGALRELGDALSSGAFCGAHPSDSAPIIIFVTDGCSDDDYRPALDELEHDECFSRSMRIGFVVGQVPDEGMLVRIVGDARAVVRTDDFSAFASMLEWVSVAAVQMETKQETCKTEEGSLAAEAVRLAKRWAGYEEGAFCLNLNAPNVEQRALSVFYMLDKSIDISEAGCLANRMVPDTLYALQRLHEDDERFRVCVSALAYDSSHSWLNSDDLVALEDFEFEELRAGMVGCTPGWALTELDSRLSRHTLGQENSNSLTLVIFVLNGYCNNLLLVDNPSGYRQILQNAQFARAARFLFVPYVNDKAELLADLTHDGRAMLTKNGSVSAYAAFSRFLDRLRDDSEWELTDRYLPLGEVVRLALWRCGPAALRNPEVLQAFVRDRMEPESAVARMLRFLVCKDLLDPFLMAYIGSISIEDAKNSVTWWLRNVCDVVVDEYSELLADELASGVMAALRDEELYASRVGNVPKGLAVLKEVDETASDGSRCLIVLVRNDADKTLRVDMTVVFSDTAGRVAGTGWRYAVVAPGDVALLYLTSDDCGANDGTSLHATYELMARESPHEALSCGLVMKEAYGVEGHKHAFELRNDGLTSAYVECVRIYAVWHEFDALYPKQPRGLREQ